jgi:hypothetical protein
MRQTTPASTKNAQLANRDRGLALSFYLMITTVIATLSLIRGCWLTIQYSGFVTFAIVSSILPLVIISFVIAIWTWKKWGYYGLVIAYLISALMSLVSGAPLLGIPIMVALVLLVALVQNKIELFD